MFEIQKIDAILIVIDRFTKYTVLIFIHFNINTVELTELIYNHIDIQFDLPSNIISNRNPIFTNEF